MKEQNTQVIPKAPEYPSMPPTFARGIDNYDIRLAYWHRHCDRLKSTAEKADFNLSKHNQFLNQQIAGFWNDYSSSKENNEIAFNHYQKIWVGYVAKCRLTDKKQNLSVNAFSYYVERAMKVMRILELDNTIALEVVEKWNDKTIDTWLRTHDTDAPTV